MAIVRELITRFGFNVDQTGINRVEGSINRLSGMLSGLAAFASLRALAGVADSMQSLEARIGMLPQTLGDVGKAFDEVAKNASDNRQSLAAYGTLYARIGNAAKDYINTQEELLTVSNTISQALVVGGSTAQEAASVMTQFSQALGAGTLQGEEFRAMAEAAPQYMDELAISLGYPRSELKKLASEGKITSKQVIEATLKMSTLFQDKFRQMPMTIGHATTIIGNKFGAMIAKLNRESQVVTTVANFLLRGFERIENGAKSFIEFVGGSSNALRLFGIALAAILGPIALGGLITILGAVFSIGGLVVGALVLLGLAIDDIYTYMEGGDSIFGNWIANIEAGSEGFKMLSVVAMGVLGGIAAKLTYTAGISALTWAANTSGAIASFATIGLASAGSAAAMILNFTRIGIVAGAMYAGIGLAAMKTGLAMAAAWVVGLGPIAWAVAAIAGIGTAVYMLWNNWDTVMGWMGNKVQWVIDKARALGAAFGVGGTLGGVSTPSVVPSTVAQSASSGGNTNVTSNQTVNLTVPPGTPESQQRFLQGAAGVLKSDSDPLKKAARDMTTGGW